MIVIIYKIWTINSNKFNNFIKVFTKLPEHLPLWFLFQKGIPSKPRGSPPGWSRAPRPESYTVCYEAGDLFTHGQSPIFGKIQKFHVIRKQASYLINFCISLELPSYNYKILYTCITCIFPTHRTRASTFFLVVKVHIYNVHSIILWRYATFWRSIGVLKTWTYLQRYSFTQK